MKIEILGTGCKKCQVMFENTKQAMARIGGFHELKKVEDIVEIMNYGVMSTPALVVDGVVKSYGKELNIDEIVEIISKA